MTFQDISLKWKTIVPLIFFLIGGIVINVAISGKKARDIVLAEVERSTMRLTRDTLLNALTTMMISGDIAREKDAFLQQMTHIADIRLVRAPVLDEQYGARAATDYPADDLEKEVIRTGRERVVMNNETLRGVYPYVARSDVMGRDCLACHQVREGTVLGAVSIGIPMAGSLARIRALQMEHIILGVLGLAGLIVLTLVIFHYSHLALMNLIHHVKDMTAKNLRVNFAPEGERDEVFLLSTFMHRLLESYNDTINRTLQSAAAISGSTDALSALSRKTRTKVQRQADQAEQIAAASTQMSQTIGDIAANAGEAQAISTRVMETAAKGKEIADSAGATVDRVNASTITLSAAMDALKKKVEEIGGIITVIDEIAYQTNILALNAAVEAARAGQHGKGFAVVAEEVRRLAERTIKATKEISRTIEAVQGDATATVRTMQVTSDEVGQATRAMHDVGSSFDHLVDGIRQVREQVVLISSAVKEQSQASQDVAGNIEGTAVIAREIDDMAESVMREVTTLSRVVDEMRQSTFGFQTKGGELLIFDLAMSDHRIWVQKVAAHLRGEEQLDPQQLKDHTTCRLGKWYYGEGMKLCGGRPLFRELEGPHQRVHAVGLAAIKAADRGETAKADACFQQLEAASGEVMHLLATLKETLQQGKE